MLPHLTALDLELERVIEVLILAAAARTEVTALRFNAVGPRRKHLQQLRATELFLHLDHLGAHAVTGRDERDEQHEVVHPRHALAPERDVRDVEFELLARLEHDGKGDISVACSFFSRR